MASHVIDEINRCLQCKNPLCRQGCPISTPIPQMIELLKAHKLNEAGEMLFDNNPLSLICSVICNHEQQCEGHCILGRKGSSVQISTIEHYISDTCLDNMQISCLPDNGVAVAVIGSGAAGIAAAIQLARLGYRVTIFDSKDRIGGVMQYGIPEFRLPKSILERFKNKLLALGIKIRLNTTIGNALRIENLFRDDYKAVFIGTGVWRPRTLGVKGESRGNVLFGIDYLANPNEHNLGQTVAIIGMGDTAMDVARTSLRHGAQKVTLYGRSNRIGASKAQQSYTQLDGADFEFGKQILEINEQGPLFRQLILDEAGNVCGEEAEPLQVQADSVIIAVSQGPRRRLVDTTKGLEIDEKGFLVVDENGQTSLPMVYAAGDVVTGPRNVVKAVAGAKKVVAAMHAKLSEGR